MQSASNTWKSQRLTYRRVDPKDDEAKAFFIEKIIGDPVMEVLISGACLGAGGTAAAEEEIEQIAKSKVGALIQIPAQEGTPDAKPTIIGFLTLSTPPPSMAVHRKAMLGIGIVEPYQNKGYGSEAINWITDIGFRHLGLHRIAIGAMSYNERAVNLYQRLGFVVEGRKRGAVWFDRQWYDMVDMSMLEDEWLERQDKS